MEGRGRSGPHSGNPQNQSITKIQLPEKQMNKSYTTVNAPYAYAHALVRCSECNFTKNDARALLSRILSIVCSDGLQHARSLRGVYEP